MMLSDAMSLFSQLVVSDCAPAQLPGAKYIFAEDIREAVMTDGMKICWVGKYE